LKEYPDVKIITGDRARAYSLAINEVSPDVIQIADWFHLLMNLSDALDKYFESSRHIIRTLNRDKINENIHAL
jgi:transposase